MSDFFGAFSIVILYLDTYPPIAHWTFSTCATAPAVYAVPYCALVSPNVASVAERGTREP